MLSLMDGIVLYVRGMRLRGPRAVWALGNDALDDVTTLPPSRKACRQRGAVAKPAWAERPHIPFTLLQSCRAFFFQATVASIAQTVNRPDSVTRSCWLGDPPSSLRRIPLLTSTRSDSTNIQSDNCHFSLLFTPQNCPHCRAQDDCQTSDG